MISVPVCASASACAYVCNTAGMNPSWFRAGDGDGGWTLHVCKQMFPGQF